MMKVVAVLALIGVCLAYEKEGDVLVLHDSDINDAIKEFPFILVEFYAPWCGHCKQLTPEYAAAATTLAGSIPLAKVDATVEAQSATTYEVRGYPTLKFFVNGEATEYTGGRTAQDIVTWINKKTGPALKPLASSQAVQNFKDSADVVLVVFADKESAEYAVAERDARSQDDVEFGVVADAAVAAELGHSFPSAVVYKKFDEGVVEFTGAWENSQLAAFVAGNSIPLVSTFSQNTASKIFGSGIKSHFLYFNRVDADSHEGHLATCREVAAEFKGKTLFVFVPSTEERVLAYFSYSATDLPKAVLVSMGEGDMKKFPLTTDFSADNIREHLAAFHAGDLRPTLKSEEIPTDNRDPVKVVVGKSFADIVLDPSKDVFVEFYAPWCGHCKALTPTWEQLAKEFEGNDSIVIAKFDGTANEVDYPGVHVRGFPTLIWFPSNAKDTPETYSGGREFDELVEFVKQHATNPSKGHQHSEL